MTGPIGTTIVRHTRRTLQRWVERAAGEMFAETEEVGWTYVSAHDLRRSWATLLIHGDVEHTQPGPSKVGFDGTKIYQSQVSTGGWIAF